MLRCGFQHVAQSGNEGVYPTTQVLQVDQDDVERIHRLRGWASDFAIETEHRNIVNRVEIIRRLDHIILLVAPQSMLGAESSGHFDTVERGKHIERMG